MRRGNSSEVGSDALDARVPRASWAAALRRVLPARRAAMGVGATAAPSLLFIAAGVILGPQLLGIVSSRVLLHLDAVVSVALATLGIFVGLELGTLTRAGGARPLLVAASAEATITIAVVAASMYLLLTRWAMPIPIEAGLLAGTLGITSCASAAVRFDRPVTSDVAFASWIADLEDVPLILLGAVVVATVVATITDWDVATIGALPSTLPTPAMPSACSSGARSSLSPRCCRWLRARRGVVDVFMAVPRSTPVPIAR